METKKIILFFDIVESFFIVAIAFLLVGNLLNAAITGKRALIILIILSLCFAFVSVRAANKELYQKIEEATKKKNRRQKN